MRLYWEPLDITGAHGHDGDDGDDDDDDDDDDNTDVSRIDSADLASPFSSPCTTPYNSDGVSDHQYVNIGYDVYERGGECVNIKYVC